MANNTKQCGDENLREIIRDEVKTKFAQETAYLKEQGLFVITVAKWAIGGIALLLAILGINAWSDIKKNVEDYFQSKLEKKYQLADPNSPIENRLNILLDRALVNALFMEVLREKSEVNKIARSSSLEREVKVFNSGEFERLLKIISNKDTDTDVFRDAVLILNSIAVSANARQKVSNVLADLLYAKKGSEFYLLKNNEAKQIIILDSFYGSENINSIATEFINKPISNNLKRSVLNRIVRENYKEAAIEIVKYIKNAEDEYSKNRGYRVLARIKPNDDYLKNFIKNELLTKNDEGSLLLCIALAGDISSSGKQDFFWRLSDDRKALRLLIEELAIPMAAKAFEAEIKLSYGTFYDNALRAVIKNKITLSSNSEVLNKNIYSNDFMSLLLKYGSDKSLNTLSKYVAGIYPESASNSDNDSTPVVIIKVLFDETSEMKFEDGTSMNKALLKGTEIRLKPKFFEKSSELIAVLEDENKNLVTKKVVSVKNMKYQVLSSYVNQDSDVSAAID